MKHYNMLEDRPGPSLLIFALPIILGNLFQQFYNMVDSIVVGKFVSEGALASVGASYAVTNVFIAVAIGGGIGSSVVISQYLGAGQFGNLKSAVSTALVNFLALGVLLGAVGVLTSGQMLTALNTPSDVFGDARLYLDIYFWGLPFLFLYNVESAIFNALGDSRTPLKLLIFSSLLNIVLDLVFVIVLRLAVAGVAIATLIAQGVSAVISFFILRRRLRAYSTQAHAARYSPAKALMMTKMAIPSIIQQSIVHVGMLLVQSVVNSFGSAVLAGFSAGMRFESICIVPMIGVGNAMSTFTAQNMGARQPQRVRRGYHASFLILFAFAAVICAALQAFGAQLLTLFLDASEGSIAYATGLSYLRFLSWFYVLIGMKACTDGVLRGAGDIAVFTTANLVNLSIRVWFAFTFAPVIGVQAVWISVPVGWAANFIISFAYYLTGRWSRKKIV